MQNKNKTAIDKSNLIEVDQGFHANHPSYSAYVEKKIKELIDADELNLSNIKDLQDTLKDLINKAKESGKKLNDYFAEDVLLNCK